MHGYRSVVREQNRMQQENINLSVATDIATLKEEVALLRKLVMLIGLGVAYLIIGTPLLTLLAHLFP